MEANAQPKSLVSSSKSHPQMGVQVRKPKNPRKYFIILAAVGEDYGIVDENVTLQGCDAVCVNVPIINEEGMEKHNPQNFFLDLTASAPTEEIRISPNVAEILIADTDSEHIYSGISRLTFWCRFDSGA